MSEHRQRHQDSPSMRGSLTFLGHSLWTSIRFVTIIFVHVTHLLTSCSWWLTSGNWKCRQEDNWGMLCSLPPSMVTQSRTAEWVYIYSGLCCKVSTLFQQWTLSEWSLWTTRCYCTSHRLSQTFKTYTNLAVLDWPSFLLFSVFSIAIRSSLDKHSSLSNMSGLWSGYVHNFCYVHNVTWISLIFYIGLQQHQVKVEGDKSDLEDDGDGDDDDDVWCARGWRGVRRAWAGRSFAMPNGFYIRVAL